MKSSHISQNLIVYIVPNQLTPVNVFLKIHFYTILPSPDVFSFHEDFQTDICVRAVCLAPSSLFDLQVTHGYVIHVIHSFPNILIPALFSNGFKVFRFLTL